MAITWVLLRGLVREQAHWDLFPERLRQTLGEGHRVLCLDLPGNGELHQQRSPTGVTAMVAAAREQLAAHQVTGPVRLVALSLGGMVAIQWLCSDPRQIQGLALINASAARFSPFWQRLRPANYGHILFQGWLGRDRLRRERMILDITTNRLGSEQKARLAERFTEVDRVRPVSGANTARQLWAALRFRAPAALPSRPVLVINGGGDRLVSPACSQALAQAWHRALKVHPDGGHDLSLDAPQ